MTENIHIRNYSNHVNLFFQNPLYSSDKKERIGFFLDRDGVLIKDKHFISNPDDVSLEGGVVEILNYLYSLKIPVIIISNQSENRNTFLSLVCIYLMGYFIHQKT